MKIDFDMLETLAAAGAPASALIAYLRAEEAKRAPKRKADRERQQAKPKRNGAKARESARSDAILDDSPRARVFREGSEILAALGRSDRGARALLSQWLKLTHDDAQLVMASLQRARDLGVADVAGWMLTTLNGKVKNGAGTSSLAAAADRFIADAREREEPPGDGVLDLRVEGR